MDEKGPDKDFFYSNSLSKTINVLGIQLEEIQSSLRIVQNRLNNAIILQAQLNHKIKERQEND